MLDAWKAAGRSCVYLLLNNIMSALGLGASKSLRGYSTSGALFIHLLLTVAIIFPFSHAFTFKAGRSSNAAALFISDEPIFAPSNLGFAPRREKYRHSTHLSRRLHVVFSSWGPEPVWESCTVVKNRVASKHCVEITVEVTPDKAQQYKIPGQYVQIRPANDQGSKPIFLAIASPPATVPEYSKFEFLVKRTNGNGFICDAAVGSKVDVSQILGQGFPMQENLEGFKYDFPTQNVILCASGSGIAPIRAAIESGQLNIAGPNRGGRTARLYYGVRTPEDLAYAEKISEWEALGFETVPVISQPDGTGWKGRTGYVQTALEEDGVPIPRNSGALLCGVKGMVDSVKSLLKTAGVFEGRILTNF